MKWIAGPTQGFWFSLRWGLSIYISSKFPDDAGAVGLAIKLTNTSRASLLTHCLPLLFRNSRVFSLTTSSPLPSCLISAPAFSGQGQQSTNHHMSEGFQILCFLSVHVSNIFFSSYTYSIFFLIFPNSLSEIAG